MSAFSVARSSSSSRLRAPSAARIRLWATIMTFARIQLFSRDLHDDRYVEQQPAHVTGRHQLFDPVRTQDRISVKPAHLTPFLVDPDPRDHDAIAPHTQAASLVTAPSGAKTTASLTPITRFSSHGFMVAQLTALFRDFRDIHHLHVYLCDWSVPATRFLSRSMETNNASCTVSDPTRIIAILRASLRINKQQSSVAFVFRHCSHIARVFNVQTAANTFATLPTFLRYFFIQPRPLYTLTSSNDSPRVRRTPSSTDRYRYFKHLVYYARTAAHRVSEGYPDGFRSGCGTVTKCTTTMNSNTWPRSKRTDVLRRPRMRSKIPRFPALTPHVTHGQRAHWATVERRVARLSS